MKQEIITDSDQLEQTQPPVCTEKKETEETSDLFSSLPNSFLGDRENSTVCAPYEPREDGTFYATTRFLYESILNENEPQEVNNENEAPRELSADTDTLFSKFDSLPSSSNCTFDVPRESSMEQNADKNPLPAKRRCVVTSETAPDVPPDAGESQTLVNDHSNTPPPPPPADYPAPRLSLNRRFSKLYENNENHIDVSSFKLPRILTIRQEHDLLSAVWDVLYK
ncbi:unnamed protein product [Auanema sp. JU1783]|nr:unnamed protein product [Auanema sp. JU1783]